MKLILLKRQMISHLGKYIHPRSLVATLMLFGILMFLYSYVEYKQSQKELFRLLKSQVHSMLEITVAASENTITGNLLLEEEIEKRLLAASQTAFHYWQDKKLSDKILNQIAQDHGLFRLMVVNSDGQILYTNTRIKNIKQVPEFIRKVIDQFLDSGEEYSTGNFFPVSGNNQYRYALFYRLDDDRAIIANIDAEELLQFRKQTGFGSLIQRIAQNKNIIYAVLQDTTGILAASSNVKEMDPVLSDSILKRSYFQRTFEIHFNTFHGNKVIEASHPLIVDDEIIGLFRIGISTEPLDNINKRAIRRFLISTFILIFLGGIMFLLMLIQQNYQLVQKQYQEVETFSQGILQHMSDGVLITDETHTILLINPVMADFLGVSAEDAVGKNFQDIAFENWETLLCKDSPAIREVHRTVRGKQKVLLISGTIVRNGDKAYCVHIARDITEQKYLQEQVARKERLMAMGQLASGVAHEIRNPLNTIATLAQQIEMDFEVQNDQEEFHQLMQIILKEIYRLNDTVEHFLKLARPEPIQTGEFRLQELLHEVEKQYSGTVRQMNVVLEIRGDLSINVVWDRRKIKQMFINLIQNALDVLKEGGKIEIEVNSEDGHMVEIHVRDNGPGIDENVLPRIFNAYFTTKPKGSGLGLSVVQQIVDLHQGTIHVRSLKNSGTEFIIRLPRITGEENKE